MSWYVGSSSTFSRKIIGKEDLMSVKFNIVTENNFLWWGLVVPLTLCGSRDTNSGSDNFCK